MNTFKNQPVMKIIASRYSKHIQRLFKYWKHYSFAQILITYYIIKNSTLLPINPHKTQKGEIVVRQQGNSNSTFKVYEVFLLAQNFNLN